MSKYINPYTDFGFKKLFGEEASKELLIDFLNALLPEKHRIKTLKFRNTEQLGPTTADRRAIYDIFCNAENGEKFIVEMQKAKQLHFKDRALFYTALPIREQAEKGDDWNFELKAVYFVGILDFEYDEKEERRKFRRDVMLKDQDGDVFYEKMQYIFLQMPLFEKTESELENHRDKWIYFLKNLVNFDRIPEILHERIFEKAFEKAELARMNKTEREQYEANLKVYRDNFAVLDTARAEGKAEGKIEGKIEVARGMKKEGFDMTMISKLTGLSSEEIDWLD